MNSLANAEQRVTPATETGANPYGAGTPGSIVHARAMVFVGFSGGDSCWSGRRTYQERRLKNGQVELVCGVGLDDVAALFPSQDFACLKSKKSREAKHVTCPECVRRIRAAGFVHVPKVQP